MHVSFNPPGTFCWFELATTDQSSAKAFYTALFGWEVADQPIGQDEVYSIFRLGGHDVGAGYTMRPEERAQGVPPNWLLYIAVASADDSAARAASLGATILAPPFDVMDHGRMCVVRDPAGAMFALWQANKHIGVTIKNVVHTCGWADLSVPDQSEGAAFYSQLFGWRMVSGKDQRPASPGDYYHIVNGDDFIGGVPPATARNRQAPPHWLLYFEVADCAASAAKARSLGGRILVDTTAIGESGSFAVVADPQGAVFALHAAASGS